jgi:Lrp/AsnC family leucine-responsive transcriptional regulator
MDKTDRNIIRALQKNARISNQELADTVNLSPSPCLRRVRALESSGIIKSYTLEVDNEAFGLPVTVFVRVQLDKHSEDVVAHFESQIKDQEKVLECFVMTGRADYLLKVVVKDLHDYEDFVRHSLHSIGCIASIDTSFAYGVVKKTTLLPDHHIS